MEHLGQPQTKINEATAKREIAAQEGRLTNDIKSITGQHQFFYIVNSLLLLDGTISTDPVQIHDKLAETFAEPFIRPQQRSHSPLQEENAIDHDKFLTSK